ncbi:MAG: glycosyltransferase family 4 protein [Tannerellaceae bacterium]|nr:glycosyltransferase family 4 protein [Tannerellaceae bacterium]
MKILFIIPGSGDAFYCGNCFRDNLQASALRKAGHDVIIMPLYLPLTDASFQADTPLFFPATSFYTEQRFFGKKKMPSWLRKILSSAFLLKIASSLSGSTSAKGTEGMTIAMITGKDAAFNREVESLVRWIKEQEKPDIIHLSSTLLIGVAKAIRQQMSIPVICSVQDEEVWIDSLDPVYATIAWQGITENIPYVDRFVTTSHYYKQIAQQRLPQLPDPEVIYPGIETEKYTSSAYPAQPVIGFFYRMNQADELDILAKAFIKLKEKNTIPGLKLKIAGGYTSQDKPFLKKVYTLLTPYIQDVEIHENYQLSDHTAFYKQISVICVPITFHEGVGLYLCESFAAGRPAVEPATGSFPEIVGEAGILYQPNNPEKLSEALEQLLANPVQYRQAVNKALSLSQTRYNDTIMANTLETLYRKVIMQQHNLKSPKTENETLQ